MTEEKFAKEQIRRLAGFDGFPKDTKAVHELVMALMVCHTDGQAARVLDDIIGMSPSGTRCPLPYDLRKMSYERVENEKAKVAPIPPRRTHCPRCHDHGFLGEHLPGEVKEARPWEWCSCSAAQERRSREPNLVDEANAARDKIIARFPITAPLGAIVNQIAQRKRLSEPDPYNGEF